MRKRSTTGPRERSQDGGVKGGRTFPAQTKKTLTTNKSPTNNRLKDSNRTRATSTHREKFPHDAEKIDDGPART
ncbi:hypothetical protein LPTSP2_21200 [Leptospira ellinghausenii]|uniref:Uncharacterized protein n=1 Tax=Leptospira ellinghausenii TaxID=1917822 RepID=A0A2P2DDZ3_9LEPT|nr:hypothetical protein LPTSP2_21200 [Leptospira ellinghausenii]